MASNSSLKRILGVGFAGALATSAPMIYASGFQNYDWSASSLGNAHAGSAARADDTATAWTNPAGIVHLPEQLMFASTLILGDFDVDFARGTSPLGLDLDDGPGGNAGSVEDDPAAPAAIPALHYVRPLPELSEDLFFGMSVSIPFGLATDYDTDSVQRYLATTSDVLTLDFNPSLAYRINDYFSIGAGFSTQYARVRLEKSISTSSICVGVEEMPGSPLPAGTCDFLGFGRAQSGDIRNDFNGRFTADDWSYGWNAGVLFNHNDNTRVGLHYRSRVPHNLEGTARFEGGALDRFRATLDANGIPDLVAATGFVKQQINGNIDLPEITTFSVFHKLTDQIDLLFDVAYTRWSRFKELKLTFENPVRGVSVVPQMYRDTWRFSVGTNYHLNQNWTLRAGYMYDESPIRTRFRTVRLPGAHRQWAAAGVQYRCDDESLIFDLSYAHVFFEANIDIDEDDPDTAATFVGDYTGGADLFGFNVIWNI